MIKELIDLGKGTAQVIKPAYLLPVSDDELLQNFRSFFHSEAPTTWTGCLEETLLCVVHALEGHDPGFLRRYEKLSLLRDAFSMLRDRWQLGLLSSLSSDLDTGRLVELPNYIGALRQLCGGYLLADEDQNLCPLYGDMLEDEAILQVLYHLFDVSIPRSWANDLDEVLTDLMMSGKNSPELDVVYLKIKEIKVFFSQAERKLQDIKVLLAGKKSQDEAATNSTNTTE